MLAALVFALPAAAAFQPVRRATTEAGPVPIVRAGTLAVEQAGANGRARVIIGLAQPPLAAWNGRSLQARTRVKLSQTPLGGERPDEQTVEAFRNNWRVMLDGLKSAAEERALAQG